MKLLLFSDLHCDTLAASQLVERSHNFDVIVCAGDLFGLYRRSSFCGEEVLAPV